MKIYRCFIGVLLVFFITLAVLYITSIYNERRSVEDGILVLSEKEIHIPICDVLYEEV